MPPKEIPQYNISRNFLVRINRFLTGIQSKPADFDLNVRGLYGAREAIDFLRYEKIFERMGVPEKQLLNLFAAFDVRFDTLHFFGSSNTSEMLMMNRRHSLIAGPFTDYEQATKTVSYSGDSQSASISISGVNNGRLVSARFDWQLGDPIYQLSLFGYGLPDRGMLAESEELLAMLPVTQANTDWTPGMVTGLMADMNKSHNKVVLNDNFGVIATLPLVPRIPLSIPRAV